MLKSRILLALIILLAFLCIGIAWALPVPPQHAHDPDTFTTTFGIANFVNILSIGTALLFLSGLSGFKQKLKTAYYLVCGGLFIQVGSTLTYSILAYVQPVERNFIGDLPITIGALFIFLGVWQLAKVLQVRSVWTNPLVLLAYLAIGSILFWIIPHGPYDLTKYLVQANQTLETLFYPIAAALLWGAMQVVSPTYARSFKWMFAAVLGNFVAGALYVSSAYLPYPEWASASLFGLLFIIDSFVYLAAGYSFSTLQWRLTKQKAAHSTIDIIIFVAGLASQPKEIDAILDQLRGITSQRTSNAPLSKEHEQLLTEIYLQLEDYLTHKEPLRSFSQAGLRELVHNKFDRLPGNLPVNPN